jgi:hypothetical protein
MVAFRTPRENPSEAVTLRRRLCRKPLLNLRARIDRGESPALHQRNTVTPSGHRRADIAVIASIDETELPFKSRFRRKPDAHAQRGDTTA